MTTTKQANERTAEPQPVTPDLFREALSRWTTGVAVLAVRGEQGVKGMTVSSFCSVSLEPPLVSVVLNNESNSMKVLQERKHYVINLLAHDQESIARHFAGRPQFDHDPFPESGPPMLEGSLASIECDLWANYPGGDHTIVVGEIRSIRLGQEKEPLAYALRGYHRLK